MIVKRFQNQIKLILTDSECRGIGLRIAGKNTTFASERGYHIFLTYLRELTGLSLNKELYFEARKIQMVDKKQLKVIRDYRKEENLPDDPRMPKYKYVLYIASNEMVAPVSMTRLADISPMEKKPCLDKNGKLLR